MVMYEDFTSPSYYPQPEYIASSYENLFEARQLGINASFPCDESNSQVYKKINRENDAMVMSQGANALRNDAKLYNNIGPLYEPLYFGNGAPYPGQKKEPPTLHADRPNSYSAGPKIEQNYIQSIKDLYQSEDFHVSPLNLGIDKDLMLNFGFIVAFVTFVFLIYTCIIMTMRVKHLKKKVKTLKKSLRKKDSNK